MGVRAVVVTTASLVLVLTGCQSGSKLKTASVRLGRAVDVLEAEESTPRQIKRAEENYRRILADVTPELHAGETVPGFVASTVDAGGAWPLDRFSDISPVLRPVVQTPGLHAAGVGLPAVGTIDPGGPNAPRTGFHLPITVLAAPRATGAEFLVTAVDPDDVPRVELGERELPVARNLEAALDETRAVGPGMFSGLRYMLRTDRFTNPRLTFLEPYDPKKIPVVLVHGLMSTPRMWESTVKGLLADPELRRRFQFWFFYYPTGQPVPLSALLLREALDEAIRQHNVRQRVVVIGHSMGGLLARALVTGISPAQAEIILPGVSALPVDHVVRRALIFEPRRDVRRVIFIATPHRGSELANHGISGLGIRLIRLPRWVESELTSIVGSPFIGPGRRLPTSIHGLSPSSPFLEVLNASPLAVPVHSIIGTRGAGDIATSSDGVVPYSSAHLPDAESEVVVPTGHGAFRHPEALAEIVRILEREGKLPTRR